MAELRVCKTWTSVFKSEKVGVGRGWQGLGRESLSLEISLEAWSWSRTHRWLAEGRNEWFRFLPGLELPSSPLEPYSRLGNAPAKSRQGYQVAPSRATKENNENSNPSYYCSLVIRSRLLTLNPWVFHTVANNFFLGFSCCAPATADSLSRDLNCNYRSSNSAVREMPPHNSRLSQPEQAASLAI